MITAFVPVLVRTDIEKARYHKIVLMARDVDGQRTLRLCC